MPKIVAILAVVWIAGAGCSFVDKRKAIKTCEFHLRETHVDDVGLTEIHLSFDVEIRNTNDIEVIVEKMVYAIRLEEALVADGIAPAKLSIPPGQSRLLTLRVRVPVLGAAAATRQLVLRFTNRRETMKIRIDGTVWLSTVFGEIPHEVKIEKVL